MAADDLSLSVGFDVDETELDSAIQDQVRGLGDEFENVARQVQSLVSDLRSSVGPLRDMRDMAKDMAASFKQAQDSAHQIKQAVASTRLQTGAGAVTGAPSAGGGGGIGLGNILGMVGGGGGGLMRMLAGGGAAALGFGAIGAGFMGIGGSISGRLEAISDAWRNGQTWREGLGSRRDRLTGILSSGSPMAPMEAYSQGYSIPEIMQRASGEQLAGSYGMVRGVFGGLGQGPIGMTSNLVGQTFGASGGYRVGSNLAADMGLPQTMGGVMGMEAGRQLMTGMVQNYIQEGMSRYPGFLQTGAALAAPRTLGATRASMRGLRPGAWGYGPGEFGGELAGLYSGFGGGELTGDTTQAAMAYSRAYGVSMGAQGQAVGGLLMAGGNIATADQRETTLLRVMTDAVAAGFGRRLPEFAQSVGGSVGIALSGPAITRADDMQDLIGVVSRATGRLSSSRGIGLQGASRLLAPWIGAPGGALRNFMGGGGDPYSTALLWQTNRSRFSNDPYQMMRGLSEAQSDPFGEGLDMMLPAVQTLLRQSTTDFGAASSLRQFFGGLGQDVSFDTIDDLISNRSGLLGRGSGGQNPRELLQALLGVEEGARTEGEELRDTMTELQETGHEIMREQLGELRANAGFAWAQYGISSRMARDARANHAAQMAETRAMADLMRAGAVGQAVRSIAALRESGASILGSGDDTAIEQYLRHMGRGIFSQVRGWNVNRFFSRGETVEGSVEAVEQNLAASRQEVLSEGRHAIQGRATQEGRVRARRGASASMRSRMAEERASTMEGAVTPSIRALARGVQGSQRGNSENVGGE